MKEGINKKLNIRWLLVGYDFIIFALSGYIFLNLYGSISFTGYLIQLALLFSIAFISRICFSVYKQVWRFGGIQCYIRLILADGVAFVIYYIASRVLHGLAGTERIFFSTMFSYCAAELLACLLIRMFYRYAYKYCLHKNAFGKVVRFLAKVFSGVTINESITNTNARNVVIIGAGRAGVSFAEELLNSTTSNYNPVMFIDVDKNKIGRKIFNLPVYSESAVDSVVLEGFNVKEFIIAMPKTSEAKKKAVYDKYRKFGLPVKVYDYPTAQDSFGKKIIRDFEIEDVLFRGQRKILDDKTVKYYSDKVVLITGGGGSIGGELCRQIAKMKPKKLIILDVYENGAYDVQQELKINYGKDLDLSVEILSVCNRQAVEEVFKKYRPQIVLHAAAHKHVPLMENNPIEAIENNVFGTLNVVDLSEKYGVEHFIMISTDKAVNPTNVMGATKRMCEMIVLSRGKDSKTVFTATRFGNVLGSAGSVVPLFKKQIANGGPITITDKRIIRYFMTIPEASQLVLTSGRLAKSGELFVLDMGNPVKILDLAENMIRLSGFVPYTNINIVETGLRPGEKLYEELLIKTESMTKTENDLIFIEKDIPLSKEEIDLKLKDLKKAIESRDSEKAFNALKKAVPTFKDPKEINDKVAEKL